MSLFDFLPTRKEFNVDPPNIHTTWQWTHSGKRRMSDAFRQILICQSSHNAIYEHIWYENYAELQISFVFAFFTLWKRVKTHVLSDQSVHITHTYCCVSKLSKFGAYLYSRVHNNTIFVFEKFPVITSLYTFRRRERIHPRGTEYLPF